jgi:hypothetical protein
MSEPVQSPVQAGWYAKKCGSLDEMRTEGIRFWQQQGGAAIRQAAWDLVVDIWKAQKRPLDELEFQRSITAVRKA